MSGLLLWSNLHVHYLTTPHTPLAIDARAVQARFSLYHEGNRQDVTLPNPGAQRSGDPLPAQGTDSGTTAGTWFSTFALAPPLPSPSWDNLQGPSPLGLAAGSPGVRNLQEKADSRQGSQSYSLCGAEWGPGTRFFWFLRVI